MKRIVDIINHVAPTRAPVVVTGETGCGKEVLAKLIHDKSGRKEMVSVNCAALPRELIESELFGSVRGSFTGSTHDRHGLFEQANNGTLLLDELTDMPLDLQPKLLRVLQDGEIRPVGATTTRKVDVRVIATLNRPPHEAVRLKMLREDLYYRLSTVWLNIPALRQRREDILPIAEAATEAHSKELGRTFTLSAEARACLLAYDWPGNVRQLLNEIHRAVILCTTGTTIIPTMLSSAVIHKVTLPEGVLSTLEERERETIVEALESHHWNIRATAISLSLGRQTLYNKIKAYGIKKGGSKKRDDARLDIVNAANEEELVHLSTEVTPKT